MAISFIGSDHSDQLTLVVAEQSFTLANQDPRFKQVIEILKTMNENDNVETELLNVLNNNAIDMIIESSDGQLQMTEDGILYEGEKIHNILVDKIYELYHRGLPYTYVFNFLDNLLQNESPASINMLWPFLERIQLPITEDGCFLGYKGVRSDFRSIKLGVNGEEFWNIPGAIIEMPRSEVEINPDIACAAGLHVGSEAYAKQWGRNGKVVCVKVNPRDCVSVPNDHDFEKLRTCRYEVLYEVGSTLEGFYNEAGESIPTVNNYVDWRALRSGFAEDTSVAGFIEDAVAETPVETEEIYEDYEDYEDDEYDSDEYEDDEEYEEEDEYDYPELEDDFDKEGNVVRDSYGDPRSGFLEDRK